MPEEKPKRQRAKRRDYKREMEGLKQFCDVNVEVLSELEFEGTIASHTEGKIAAFQAVLKRIGGGK